MNHNEDLNYSEDFWVDFLEDELEDSLNQDLQTLLNNSAGDAKLVASLSGLKELLADEKEPEGLPEDGRYYDRLQRSIMSEIERAPKPGQPIISNIRFWTRTILGSSTLTLILLFAIGLEVHRTEQLRQDHELNERLNLGYAKTAKSVATSLDFRAEDEVLTEVVSQKLAHLDEKQARILLQNLRN